MGLDFFCFGGYLPTVVLSKEQIQSFHTNGFLTIEAISPPEEIAVLRDVFERLLKTRAGFNEGAQFDLVGGGEESSVPKLLQILNPINYAPELRNTFFRINAIAIAKQLLGEEASPFFEHAILKPARSGRPMPWHQDEAYRFEPDFEYKQLGIWMPLQPATLENGCMHYIPGSNHREVLPHRSANNDPKIHALECCGDFNPADAVACLIPAGGCTIHDGRTLHYSGQNHSDAPRWAYILDFDLPPARRTEKRDFPWHHEKQSADLIRKREWLRKGGFIVESWRMIRRGVPMNRGRLAYFMRRLGRALSKR
ncbi:MAG: phytanoyl-CoA dioxygenase family protein [Pseudomonadota bacterium]